MCNMLVFTHFVTTRGLFQRLHCLTQQDSLFVFRGVMLMYCTAMSLELRGGGAAGQIGAANELKLTAHTQQLQQSGFIG